LGSPPKRCGRGAEPVIPLGAAGAAAVAAVGATSGAAGGSDHRSDNRPNNTRSKVRGACQQSLQRLSELIQQEILFIQSGDQHWKRRRTCTVRIH
ncbi:unnamed protein product, partial [Staurois parvus]